MEGEELENLRETARSFTRKIAKRWGISHIEPEQVGDIADMAVAEALRKYNPEKGAMTTCLWWQCLEWARRHVEFEVHQTASPIGLVIPEGQMRYEDFYAAKDTLRKLATLLNRNQYNVLKGIARDEDGAQVGRRLGLSRSRVSYIKIEIQQILLSLHPL